MSEAGHISIPKLAERRRRHVQEGVQGSRLHSEVAALPAHGNTKALVQGGGRGILLDVGALRNLLDPLEHLGQGALTLCRITRSALALAISLQR